MVTPEVQRARDHFKVFLLAARRCNEFRELPPGYLQFLSVPTIVLYAFVIEIGFKALALHTLGTAPKGHDLAALFRALPAQVQIEIRKETSHSYPGSDPYFHPGPRHGRRCLRSLALHLREAPCGYRPRLPATARPRR